jgi:hypothetical protein
MSRDAKEVRAWIRTLLKGLAASVAVAVAATWVLSTVIRDAASTTSVAPAPANDRAAALGERGPDKARTPAVEGNPDSPAVRGSSDPHSKVPDSFEAYSADFTAGEPIPPEMLKRLEHAKGLLFEEAKVKQGG